MLPSRSASQSRNTYSSGVLCQGMPPGETQVDGLVVDAAGQTRRITGTLLRAEDGGSDATWITPDPVNVGGFPGVTAAGSSGGMLPR